MKRPLCKALLSSAALICSVPATASTWNFLWVGTENTRFFFDADTVEKAKDKTLMIWIKTVQTLQADSDGSWASAYRWKINCAKRTLQVLTWSTYDRDGKFIKSGSNPSAENAVIPDSTGEGVLKIACEQRFPSDTSGTRYFKLPHNDVFLATRNYVDIQKSEGDTAPK